MSIPRTLAVFICAAGAALALATMKALAVGGLATLPPGKVLVFAASMFGVLAALVDWALLRNLLPSGNRTPRVHETPRHADSAPPQSPPADAIIARARLRPIVFREICPPPATGLSFYGGAPVGPANLAWPRKKPDDTPLSFLMQWDCAELSGQDVTGLLPRQGVLYLFADLGWSAFQFVHAPGPVSEWQSLPVPPDLPPLYGSAGAYHAPYCSSLVPHEPQHLPRLLPKWPFTPLAFSYPEPQAGSDSDAMYWGEGDGVGEALLRVQHSEGVPPAAHLNKEQSGFKRPFSAFPHDYAAIRIVAAKVLKQLQYPAKSLLRNASEQERDATIQRWRDQASQHYAAAAAHDPAARVEQTQSDTLWHWMEDLEPVLRLGWGSLVEECVNVSLGLGTQVAGTLPAELVARCAERHRLALAYLHEEYADRSKPEAYAAWEKRKAEGSLNEVRSVHAPCPNHMFGPPSYVQGYVEEHLEDCLLLLELSTRQPIGHEFGEGVLQFMIRPSDLREGRFDKAMLIASAY